MSHRSKSSNNGLFRQTAAALHFTRQFHEFLYCIFLIQYSTYSTTLYSIAHCTYALHHIWGGEQQGGDWGDDRAEVVAVAVAVGVGGVAAAAVLAAVPAAAAVGGVAVALAATAVVVAANVAVVVDMGSLSMKFQEQLDQQR